MKTVPLVFYSNGGGRQVIGTAEVDEETLEVTAHVSHPVFADQISQNRHFSVGYRTESVPFEAAWVPTPALAVPESVDLPRIKLPEN